MTTVFLLTRLVRSQNVKFFFKKAKKQTIRELSRETPDSAVAKLSIASTALRAYRKRHLGTFMRCCEAWKPVEDCFDPISFECVDFRKLSQIIANLTRANLAEREAEITNLLRTQTEGISLARCRNSQRAWRNKKAVLTLSAVTDEECHTLENEDDSGGRLCEYWRSIFQHREEGPRHLHHEEIFRLVQQAPDDINGTIDQAEFDDFLTLKKTRLLDVVEYLPVSTEVLVALLQIKPCWREAVFLIVVLKSRTVFIPQTSILIHLQKIIHSPDTLRPLTL